jgi:hypothetical protein
MIIIPNNGGQISTFRHVLLYFVLLYNIKAIFKYDNAKLFK